MGYDDPRSVHRAFRMFPHLGLRVASPKPLGGDKFQNWGPQQQQSQSAMQGSSDDWAHVPRKKKKSKPDYLFIFFCPLFVAELVSARHCSGLGVRVVGR